MGEYECKDASSWAEIKSKVLSERQALHIDSVGLGSGLHKVLGRMTYGPKGNFPLVMGCPICQAETKDVMCRRTLDGIV